MHTEEIAETKATRPNLVKMLGNEEGDDAVDKKFTHVMRKGNNGLDSTGQKAALYVNMAEQERVMTTGENERVPARLTNDPEYDVRIDGICYKGEEILSIIGTYKRNGGRKVQYYINQEVRRRLMHSFRKRINQEWDVTYRRPTQNGNGEWRDKELSDFLREWDWDKEENQEHISWELFGITGIPPQIYQAQLGRMSAMPLQY